MGSPIERQLFDALCVAADHSGVAFDEPSADLEIGFHGRQRGAARTFLLFRNHQVGTYRVDILLVGGEWRLAIECDGHDFHDRTKQQAAYDRARDRELLLQDVQTIRFTGSEIVHSAERCAAEALRIMEHLDDRDILHRDLLDRCGEIHRRDSI